jgi:hypothetical protein
MSRIFGWDYPPGVSRLPWDEDRPCACCGRMDDECICPECPTCGGVGDPHCYSAHGLKATAEQVASLAEAEKAWAGEAEREAEAWKELQEMERLAKNCCER